MSHPLQRLVKHRPQPLAGETRGEFYGRMSAVREARAPVASGFERATLSAFAGGRQFDGRACAIAHRNLTTQEWNQHFGPTVSPRKTCAKLP